MIILSHRGYWRTFSEKNTADAFLRSFSLSFGTETDVRDYQGELVISHDLPTGKEITLRSVLTFLHNKSLPLALNIKADGLAPILKDTLQCYDKNNWFVFDMSIPDLREQLAFGNPVFARVSEVEPEPVYLEEITGIWLDAFYEDYWRFSRIDAFLKMGKKVCLVSPELHGRNQTLFWEKLRQQPYSTHPNLMLCTDFPETAHSFFSS